MMIPGPSTTLKETPGGPITPFGPIRSQHVQDVSTIWFGIVIYTSENINAKMPTINDIAIAAPTSVGLDISVMGRLQQGHVSCPWFDISL
jgi:hypothetical protein